jgi:hypothetical protein
LSYHAGTCCAVRVALSDWSPGENALREFRFPLTELYLTFRVVQP